MNILGVDIGGTKIAAGVVDGDTGTVLHSDRVPTNAQDGGAAVLARAITLARRVCEAAGAPIFAVGIGAGGQIDYRTGIVLSATEILPGWAGTRLAESFAEAFGVPAWADNDVNAFAQGEYRFGAGRGATDCVFLTLGTGVGGAIVADGKLHRGKRGTGGELGHLLVPDTDGTKAVTLESRVCGDALARVYDLVQLWFWRSRPATRVQPPVTGLAVGVAARSGDDFIAVEAVCQLAKPLGVGLASLANVLDTERFVIGGGVSELGDLLLKPARETFAQYVLPLYADTKIVAAELGKNSSVIGAACVALSAVSGEPLRGAAMERNTVV